MTHQLGRMATGENPMILWSKDLSGRKVYDSDWSRWQDAPVYIKLKFHGHIYMVKTRDKAFLSAG